MAAANTYLQAIFSQTGADEATRGNDPLTDTVVVSVPSDDMTGTIMVKVLDGTPSTSTQTFAVEGSGSDPTPEITSINPESGSLGTDVTITGQNFGATETENEVIFLGAENDNTDDKIAVISTGSTTQLVVEVPEDAMTGKISVTVDGETTTSSQVFTVRDGTEPPSPFSTPSSEGVISVYPNPTSGELQFTGLSATGMYAYKLYSLLGQEIRSDVLQATSIDVSSLSEGQYILVIYSEEGRELLRTRLLIVK